MNLLRGAMTLSLASYKYAATFSANLAAMPGFVEMSGVSVGADGSVNPLTQLFRSPFVGVETGPMVSQVIVCGDEIVVVVYSHHTRFQDMG